jgi:tetratricopeptide (TPR) repeat protein
MDYFARALEVRPTSTEAHSGMAYCYLSKHQLSAAVASFKSALKTNRSYGPALIGLAQALEKKGDAAGAIEYYERYLDVHSSGGQAAMARNKIKKLEKSTSSGASPAEGGQDGTGSEVEIKNSVGQPSSDEPTTAGDPYD